MALRHVNENVNEDVNEDENENEDKNEDKNEEETTTVYERRLPSRRTRTPLLLRRVPSFRQKTEYSPGAHRVTSHATAYVSRDGHGHGSLRVGA